jgi:DUF1680 family protein
MRSSSLFRRQLLQGTLAGGGLLALPSLVGCAAPVGDVGGGAARLARPVLRAATEGAVRPVFSFGGILGERLAANHRHWLLLAPSANPAMTDMFVHRLSPPRLPWAGELAGKYLIAAAQAYRIERDPSLLAAGSSVVDTLIAAQDASGYLGPFAGADRMKGWDGWGQYHCMLGLYLWHVETTAETQSTRALDACLRAAEFLRTYAPPPPAKPMAPADAIAAMSAGDEEQNLALVHVFAILGRATGNAAYGAFARALYDRWYQVCYAGETTRRPARFVDFARHRWESLHHLQALAELSHLLESDPTAADSARGILLRAWESILSGDVHNTGGFGAGERATGNPYDPEPIETCGTVAWMALTIDVLRMTGDVRAADALEIATWSAVLGAQSPEGHMWTYDTPMGGAVDENGKVWLGTRTTASDQLWWQGEAFVGGRALSCCAMNGPRALGCLSEWAVMISPDGVTVNHYGPSEWQVALPGGGKVTLAQTTTFPQDGTITMTVTPDTASRFVLRLRVPAWSARTSIAVNGAAQSNVAAGAYFAIDRTWSAGDAITLTLDMTPRLVKGAAAPAGGSPHGSTLGRGSIYVGPVLMAFDARFGTVDPARTPLIDPARVPEAKRPASLPLPAGVVPPLVTLSVATDAGSLTLCDFASAGTPSRPRITGDLVTGAVWQLGRADGTVLGERVRFIPGGAILGSGDSSATTWALDDGDLVIRSASGVTARIFTSTLQNGTAVLKGPSLVDPTSVVVLSEQRTSFVGRPWRFQRADGSVIASRITLGPNGAIAGYFHPNEASWGMEGDILVFYNMDRRATTRFESQRTRRGKTVLRGGLVGNPSIEHVLVEIEEDVTRNVWRFDRIEERAAGRITPLVPRLRLLADGTILRYRGWEGGSPNEARWGLDGGQVVFFTQGGAISTRFDRATSPDRDVLSGPFLLDPSLGYRHRPRPNVHGSRRAEGAEDGVRTIAWGRDVQRQLLSYQRTGSHDA